MSHKAAILTTRGCNPTVHAEKARPYETCCATRRAAAPRPFARQVLTLVLALAVVTALPNEHAFAGNLSPAQRCQKAIDHVARRYVRRRLRTLFKCATKKIWKDRDVTTCLGARRIVRMSVSKKDRERLAKACPTDVITGPPSENAVGFRACITPAPCPTPTDPSSLADCIECSHEFATECLFRTVYNELTKACESL